MTTWLSFGEAVARASMRGMNADDAHNLLWNAVTSEQIVPRITTRSQVNTCTANLNGVERLYEYTEDVPTKQYSSKDIDAWIEKISPVQSKGKGGRARDVKWDDFYCEIVRIANQPDGLPATQARLIEKMQDWCLSNWHEEPSDSVLKDRISRIYKKLS